MHSPPTTTPHHPPGPSPSITPVGSVRPVLSFISPSDICCTFQAPYFRQHLWLHILLSTPPPTHTRSPPSSSLLYPLFICPSLQSTANGVAVARETAAHAELTASFMPFCSSIAIKDPPLFYLHPHSEMWHNNSHGTGSGTDRPTVFLVICIFPPV